MQDTKDVLYCYNKTADRYADQFMDELNGKHLDRILLKAFAATNFQSGRTIDLGCGPGQTTKFLADCGMTDIVGTDLSPEMITVAKRRNPQLHFETADMLNLPYKDASFGSAIAFYAVVHFDEEQMKKAFKEVARILSGGAQFLFSFHVGNNSVHLDNFLEQEVNIDFYFFETSKILALMVEAGFNIIDALEREPYKGAEHPSQRAYIWVTKNRST